MRIKELIDMIIEYELILSNNSESKQPITKIMAKIILLWVLKKHFALRDEIFDN